MIYYCFCRSSSNSSIKCSISCSSSSSSSSYSKLFNEKVSRIAITWARTAVYTMLFSVHKIKLFIISCSGKLFPNFAGQLGEVDPTMMRHDEKIEWMRCVKRRIQGLSSLREFLFNARCASSRWDLAIFNPICSATFTSFHSFDSLAVRGTSNC